MAGQSGKHDVMISYSWANKKETVHKIRDHLISAGLTCWIDVTEMYGCTASAMANAVENCLVFLMCYSSQYYKSTSCRREALYAANQSKIIIPCKMESDYEPTDWLGFIIAAKLYFDFSGKFPFEQKIQELIREIKIHLKMETAPALVDEGLVQRSKTTEFSKRWLNRVSMLEAAVHKKVDQLEIDDWKAFMKEIKRKK